MECSPPRQRATKTLANDLDKPNISVVMASPTIPKNITGRRPITSTARCEERQTTVAVKVPDILAHL
jgi:hypothetical protein